MSANLRSFARILGVKSFLFILACGMMPLSAADIGTSLTGPQGSHPVIGDGTSLLFFEGSLHREFELKRDEIFAKSNLSSPYAFKDIPAIPNAAGLVDYVEQLNRENEDLDALLVVTRKWNGPLSRRVITRDILVQLKDDQRTIENALALAETYGVVLRTENISLRGWVILVADSSIDSIAKAGEIAMDELVIQAGPRLLSPPQARVCDSNAGSLDINDPLFGQQWFYNENLGPTVQVQPVWLNRLDGAPFLQRFYTGEGVRIGIADGGVEVDHEDLDRNTPGGIHYDFIDGDRDPTPSGDPHGTNVAGLAAARGSNGLGIIGAAPNADIIGLRWLGSATPAGEMFNYRSASIDVLNNSWGPPDPYEIQTEYDMDELEKNVNLRDRIFTWSVPNGLEDDYLESYDMYANSRFTLSVGALNAAATQASYSSEGPGLFTVGYASDGDLPELISTTPPSAYTTNGMEGTSFACPMVSGIVAMMLEARPDLSWRDVQAIIRETATGRDPETALFPPLFLYFDGWGFASGAMALKTAETWALLPDDRETHISDTVNDDIGGGIVDYFFDFKDVSDPNMIVEHVELDVEWRDDGTPDLPATIEITSPTGFYASGEPLNPNGTFSEGGADGYPVPLEWKYTAVGFWGENSTRGVMNGVWRVRVGGVPGERRLRKMTLRLYGTPNSFAPFVNSATVTVASDPGVDNPRVAADDEDITVSGIELQDFDLDNLDLDFQWQVQMDERSEFTDIPGQSGSFADICNYAGPKADFTISDYPIRRTERVEFTDISSAGCETIVSWDWDFGDGEVSTLQNPSHTYADTTPGEVLVTLTVTDSLGGVDMFTKPIRVVEAGGDTPADLLPLLYNDPPFFTGGQNFFGGSFVLPGSVTTAGYSYRLVLIPRDEDRLGERFLTDPIFILATPPGLAAHGLNFSFDAKLPINFTAPYELPPYVLVNEFSQGDIAHPANGEWVELLTTVDVDLRNFAISNNIVTFDTSFAELEYWRKVPAGTLITIYNNEFPDYTLPPDDFDYTDGFLVMPANSEFLTLPSNGDGWGEFPNFSPAFVSVLNQFCAPISGVSFNGDNSFVQLNAEVHGGTAENISQHEAAWVTAGTLFDGDGVIGGSYSEQLSWVVGTAAEATPGAFNPPANVAILGEISTLLDIVDPGGAGGPVNTVPEYSYSPLIPGITIDPETGVLSGVIDMPEGGEFDITVTRELSWDTFSQSFTLRILPAADDSDTDFDGVTALAERAMGMNNSVADPELLPKFALVDSGGDKFVYFGFRRLSAAFDFGAGVGAYTHIDSENGDIEYSVWISTDLVNWTNASASGALTLVSDSAGPFPVNDVIVRLNQPLSALGGQIYIQLRFDRLPVP